MSTATPANPPPRTDLFAKLMTMPMSFFNKTKFGRILSRMTSDIDSVRVAVQDVAFVVTIQAIQLKSFLLGIVKGTFFGFLVAYTGCLRGMQSGHTAAAVGQAATRAVVSGISAIIASDGIFAVLCNALRI